MAREIQSRPPLRDALGKWGASRAGDLAGFKNQVVADGATGGAAVAADAEANLHLSEEATDAHSFTGLDPEDESVAMIAHTFKRQGSEVITVTLSQKIDGNTSYTLDAAGSAITVAGYADASGAYAYALLSAVGSVTAVP